MNRLRSIVAIVASLLLALPFITQPQTSVNAQDNDDAVEIVAAGLTNPRGFAWGGDGTLYVAEGGTGGETPGDPETPPPLGPIAGGQTASVSWIAEGCPVMFADEIPSYITATGEASGAADVAILDGKLYVLVTGGGALNGNPETPSGLYTIAGSGDLDLVVDLGAWLRDNPVANVPPADYSEEGAWFDLAAAPDGDALWIVESNSQQLLSVTPEGEVARVADLSGDNQVPTVVAAGPAGAVYVGYLSGAPYPNGAAKVVAIGPDGGSTVVWTGLTTITGLAVAEDGSLLALEMSTGNTSEAPFLVENSGRIVRQTGPDSAEAVATDLNLPTHLTIGPDGDYYVSSPAIGANGGTGVIIRVAAGGDEPISAADLDNPFACGGATEVDLPTPSADAGSETTVSIVDFGFEPAEVEIQSGTTVTWSNDGEVEHTTVHFEDGKKTWDSDIMEPGDVYSFTFAAAGTYDYVCGLHPSMEGTIVVTE